MVDFKSIETFLWVVTLGSFRGAAHRLNTTQPAISQRIAQLEIVVPRAPMRSHQAPSCTTSPAVAASPTPTAGTTTYTADINTTGFRSTNLA